MYIYIYIYIMYITYGALRDVARGHEAAAAALPGDLDGLEGASNSNSNSNSVI